VVARITPQLYCTLSSEVAPVPGEYERTSTTAINAYAGHTTRNYLNSLSKLLIAAG
jgi:N-methylhydantoinase A